MDNAPAESLPHSSPTGSCSPMPQVVEQEKADDGVLVDSPDILPASDGTADRNKESASSPPPSPAPSQSSVSSWSKSNPLSPEDIILRPLVLTKLPPPQANAPLFLPANADRLWYTGFVKPWKKFADSALDFWHSLECRDGFAAIADHPMIPARITERERELVQAGQGAGILHAGFQREVLDLLQRIYIRLLKEDMFPIDAPHELFLGDVEDEDLENAEQQWEPSYVVKGARGGNEESLRVLGQVEYLGRQEGALTAAIQDLTKNSWGSLRCVLGNIAKSMLISSTRHAFLVSADEIMFLRFDLVEKTEYNTPNGEPVDLFTEPWLKYSDPIKFSATLDESEGTVPLKVAMLYLYTCALEEDWELQGEVGNSLKYFGKTRAGERYLPSFGWLKKK